MPWSNIARMMRPPIEAALRKGLAHDVLVIVGGVSVGARDLVKPALTSVGAQTDLWRVSVKPGKPFLFGRAGPCAIFGLPGNPVSAFVTFLLFVRPAMLRMMGANESELSLPVFDAQLTEEVQNRSDRPHYVRGRVAPGEIYASGPSGISRAVWFEPGECASPSSGRVRSFRAGPPFPFWLSADGHVC